MPDWQCLLGAPRAPLARAGGHHLVALVDVLQVELGQQWVDSQAAGRVAYPERWHMTIVDLGRPASARHTINRPTAEALVAPVFPGDGVAIDHAGLAAEWPIE